jgi:hypothetical protein
MTTTKTTAKDADPNDAVVAKIAELREALIAAGMDEALADHKLVAVQPNVKSTVGNFADLQRLGADQVDKTGGISDAFVPPAEAPTEAAEKSAGVVS